MAVSVLVILNFMSDLLLLLAVGSVVCFVTFLNQI